MFVLDSLLIHSLRFILDKVAAAAEAELHDDTALRERLLEAQMQLEQGEISADELDAIERDVFARIREIKGKRTDAISLTEDDGFSGVEIESWKPEK